MDNQNQKPVVPPSDNPSGNGKNRRRRRHRNNKSKNANRNLNGEKINTAEISESDEELLEIDDGIFDTPEVTVSIQTDDSPVIHVAGVRFKSTGKVYYFDKKDLPVSDGMNVVVDTSRGMEFGEVAFADKAVHESSIVLPLREITRIATADDVKRHAENKQKEEEAFRICSEKILKHKLDMKLIEVQYTFDNSKLLFYFTSSGRVDFRELVKDLAAIFKTRIELRQIGIRDEAKLLGGLGACGRPLCCSTFLSDFVQVSIKMAKEQNLSLNSGKISGCCGRLMCCLQYEYSTYAEETAKTPPVDSTVKTADGIGTVIETYPLRGSVKVRINDQPNLVPKVYPRDEVKVISKPQPSDKKD